MDNAVHISLPPLAELFTPCVGVMLNYMLTGVGIRPYNIIRPPLGQNVRRGSQVDIIG